MKKDSLFVQSIFEIMPSLDKAFFLGYFDNHPISTELNKTHIRTLLFLYRCGPQPMSYFSNRLHIEKGSFTTVAKKLIALEYIEKNPSEEDRRVHHLSLTKKGHEVAKELHDGHRIYLHKQYDLLDSKEKSDFEDALDTVLVSLKKIYNESK